MPDFSSLLSDAERIAELADSLSVWFAGELGDVLLRLERRLRDWIDEEEPSLDAARAALVRSDLRAFLRQAGYDTIVAEASVRGLDALAAQVLTTSSARTVARIPESLSQRIAGLQSFLGLDLLDQGDVVARDLWRAVMRGVVAGEDRAALVSDLAETLDRSVLVVRTLYDTSVSIYARQVEALQSTGEPDEAFLYAGPSDGRIRPFCYERVGKVYTRKEIDTWDNGQIANPMLSCGGWNCRHTLIAISKFSELQDYVGTDKRLPEVTASLRQAQRDRKAA